MKILFTSAPGYGLMLPLIPLAWAARAAGHEVLFATTAEVAEVGADAGLAMVDVFPERDVWGELMARIGPGAPPPPDELSEEERLVKDSGSPFGVFTLTMTEGTIAAGRAFGADLVVYPSDHGAGPLTALALGKPALEVGNRISWSMRDEESRGQFSFGKEDALSVWLREKLSIPEGPLKPIARIDPRAPSMGGISADEPDPRDGVPWWSMEFVPYNGGAVAPGWLAEPATRPRVCVTLGTVVPALSGTTNLTAVIEALGEMDVDVVLAAGTADLSALGTLPDNVRSAGFLPLSMILPSCSLIVHHGGSGSTAAPLFYGVPQLVLPAFADNFISADRVAARGVGLRCDAAGTDAATARTLIERLLTEPAFTKAAAEVRTEIAEQPSPAAIIDRVTAALGR
ncbi:MAG: putative glycosyltransferase [Amycolatopsis sp.]|uniref:nucleotide disphospho-sugar-binding domain-containing protein n=1 Tax=Amycolatopsis sp. TaxID=37632 RepID=UPI0026264DCD|nr:nucleotide disphospho-sugar-binding domain-containing protein [Amycolatopsis sp.]MCU1686477.1 putative glycosyltransferase [Amycolatopsis sp.]